ncbi:hypothetical protein HYH02_010937 [Chlamydomonas schloesseri]|uniref:Jacalin-type lectin domain-containing protein n=1 Tax=Chlamydomonas schloesseri TaxID=2026947 RepID=A0A835W7C1_9CHLO|nr:hypothetical protein HYH02_010937 [Chlamydomonas schloesseri]|eukprot:KAG2438236.1 hypothetical protein HYH02_010937 [Chlamydomonas schloesseri]
MAGYDEGDRCRFKFEPGERVTRLSMWGKADGSRWGGLRLATTLGRTFEATMQEPLGEELNMDEFVGAGLLMGVHGREGADIDCLGFTFLRRVAAARLLQPLYAHPLAPAAPAGCGSGGGSGSSGCGSGCGSGWGPPDVRVDWHTLEEDVLVDNHSGAAAKQQAVTRAVNTWLLREWQLDHLPEDHYGVYVTVEGAAPVLRLAAADTAAPAAAVDTDAVEPCCRGRRASRDCGYAGAGCSPPGLRAVRTATVQVAPQPVKCGLADVPRGCGLKQVAQATVWVRGAVCVPAGQARRCRLQVAVLGVADVPFDAYLELTMDNGAAWCRQVHGRYRGVDATCVRLVAAAAAGAAEDQD